MYSTLAEMMFMLFLVVAAAFVIKASFSFHIPPYEFGTYEAYQFAHIQCYDYSDVTPVLTIKSGQYIRYMGDKSKVLQEYADPC